jgi:hypothetical protein
LLCSRCHLEAPNVSDPSFIWLWLRAHATPFYDTYNITRGFEEFEKLFGRKPFGGKENLPLEKIELAMQKHMQRTCHHFGEHLNASTVAWLLAQVEQEVDHLSIDK